MKRSDSAMSRSVGDELVILDVHSARYFGLNDVGAFIWEQLEHDRSRDDLVDAVVAEYSIDPRQASTDVDELSNQLVDRGLIEM